jgi:exo-poly-alpha-galacturonosidase
MPSQQRLNLVERAAAIAFANNTDKAILNNCKVIGRQDTFFGGVGARVVVYKGDVLGAVDYIFGGMTAVFYKTKLVMNVTDATNDLAYITAAQQSSGRGYLMYACTVTSTTAGVDTNSSYRANPGYFGRPWQANTSEVVFYNTTIETSNNPSNSGLSLITPLGWNNSLGGTSSGMYEYGTTEQSGVNNSSNRATWATYLTNPVLNDGTPITAFNFTKGNDNWDPISILDNSGTLDTNNVSAKSSTKIYGIGNELLISNIKNNTKISIYNISGSLQKTLNVNKETKLTLPKGIWIVTAQSIEGLSSTKILIK